VALDLVTLAATVLLDRSTGSTNPQTTAAVAVVQLFHQGVVVLLICTPSLGAYPTWHQMRRPRPFAGAAASEAAAAEGASWRRESGAFARATRPTFTVLVVMVARGSTTALMLRVLAAAATPQAAVQEKAQSPRPVGSNSNNNNHSNNHNNNSNSNHSSSSSSRSSNSHSTSNHSKHQKNRSSHLSNRSRKSHKDLGWQQVQLQLLRKLQ